MVFPGLKLVYSSVRKLTSKMSANIKTFIFLDLETTGLPQQENNTTKIAELCAIAIQTEHLELGVFPRVCNKLSLCFNPNKLINPVATEITGLSNKLLEHQSKFTSETVEALKNFLNFNREPVCFVAHNGNRFDYPILQAEIFKTGNHLGESVLCVDSLDAFKNLDRVVEENVVENENRELNKKTEVPFEFNDGFDDILAQACDEMEKMVGGHEIKRLTPQEVQQSNETTPKKQIVGSSRTVDVVQKRDFSSRKRLYHHKSYKLQDVYSRLLSKPPVDAHEAEGDVRMLVAIAAVYGEKFVEYANEHAKRFIDIPMMQIGKRIGT